MGVFVTSSSLSYKLMQVKALYEKPLHSALILFLFLDCFSLPSFISSILVSGNARAPNAPSGTYPRAIYEKQNWNESILMKMLRITFFKNENVLHMQNTTERNIFSTFQYFSAKKNSLRMY